MEKIDKVGRVFNIILSVTYIPLSIFSWLSQMASESTIGATNPLYISLIEIFCAVSFIVPLLCIAGIIMSVVLRKKGYSIIAFIIQFFPLLIFVLNLILLYFAESVATII